MGRRMKADGGNGQPKTFTVPLGTEIYEIENSHKNL
jgi:hypothetical protein